MVREVVTTPLERNYSLVLLFISDDPKCAACGYVRGSASEGEEEVEEEEEEEDGRCNAAFADLSGHSSPA